MLQAFTLMFTLGLVVAGARLLVKSAQPGQSERASLIVIGMLFLAFLIAACAILIAASPGDMGCPDFWTAMVKLSLVHSAICRSSLRGPLPGRAQGSTDPPRANRGSRPAASRMATD